MSVRADPPSIATESRRGGTNEEVVWRRAGLWCGAIAAALGALGLASWLADRPVLSSFFSGYPLMAPVGALGFVLLGTALFLYLQKANARLRDSERNFRQLAETIREVFWMTDPTKNRMIYISPGYEEIWGRTCQSLYASPRNWLEAIHPEDRERVLQATLTKQIAGGYNEVYRIVRSDGSVRWIQDRAFPIRDDSGQVYRVAGLAEDITERKLTEGRLAAQHGVIRALAESATLGEGAANILQAVCGRLGCEAGAVWEVRDGGRVGDQALRCMEVWCAPDSGIEDFSMVTRATTFRRGEGLPGRVWEQGRAVWIPDLAADGNFARGEAALCCGLRSGFAFPILRSNQVVGVIEFFSHRIWEPDQPLLAMLSALGGQIGQFIARTQSEEALREAEAKYRSIYENATEGIFQTTLEGRYLSANPALARMLGYASPEELLHGVTDIGNQMCVRPESRAELRRRLEADGLVVGFENEIYRKDGRKIWIRVNAHAVRNGQGQVLYYEGTSQDITERKLAEAQLVTLAHAVESTAEMICITDLEDRFTFVNRAFLQAYGYSKAEILGKTPEILFSPNNPELLKAEILAQTRLGGWRGEVLDRRKDGTEFPVYLSTSQIKDRNGRVLGLMGVAQDITARKQVEKQTAALSLLGYWLSSATTPRQAADIIFEIASNLFGWDAGYLHLYSAAQDRIVPVLTVDTVGAERQPVPETSFTLEPSPLMREVMKDGARLIDQANLPSMEGQLVPFGDITRRSASKMYVPINSQGAALGILSIQSYTPHAYSQDDLMLLQTLANHCGDALRRIDVAEALREAEVKYRSIFENATEGIFQTTPDGRYLNANPALARMFGYESRAELISCVSNIERQTFVSAEAAGELKRLLGAQDAVEGFEAERYRKDGGKFWTSINVRTVREPGGEIRYYEGTVQDITKRKRAEQQSLALRQAEKQAEAVLRESEEKFRTLFESAPIGIALHDSRGHYVHTNYAYQRMLGYTGEELLRLGVRAVTHAEDIPEGRHLFDELLHGRRDRYEREKRYLRKDGRTVWAQSSASAVRNDKGRLSFIISMVEDITQRKEAMEALRESERKLRLIAENTTDVIFAFDMKRQPVYINPAVEQLTGYTFAEIRDQKFINWIHPNDQERMLKLWEELYRGNGYSDVEFRLIPKAGDLKWCSSTWGALLDENGQQIGVQGRERDITERKRLEGELLEISADERRRLGHELHDGLGQYLAGIALKTKALEEDLTAERSARARKAKELVRLMNETIRQTRNLAHGLDPVHVEADGLVAALASLAAQTRELFGVDCAFLCRHERLEVNAQTGLAIYRITQEAIHNAVTHGEAHRLRLELALDNSHLSLKIEDNGKGFSPASTTASGLGLRTMRYRANSIGATLMTHSDASTGTKIECRVPWNSSLVGASPKGIPKGS